MADGRIAEQGPPQQIRQSKTVAAKYLGHDDV
jgi:ABC-type branched-subunit amino acid transport system ATPase component